MEVHSCWGSGLEHADPLWEKSEKPGSGVFNALARGYRFGFIGCGDSHSGMPGRSFPQDRQWCVMRKSGFTGVYAPELTREAIFDALRARRTWRLTTAHDSERHGCGSRAVHNCQFPIPHSRRSLP